MGGEFYSAISGDFYTAIDTLPYIKEIVVSHLFSGQYDAKK
jgi:hypothetical protein